MVGGHFTGRLLTIHIFDANPSILTSTTFVIQSNKTLSLLIDHFVVKRSSQLRCSDLIEPYGLNRCSELCSSHLIECYLNEHFMFIWPSALRASCTLNLPSSPSGASCWNMVNPLSPSPRRTLPRSIIVSGNRSKKGCHPQYMKACEFTLVILPDDW